MLTKTLEFPEILGAINKVSDSLDQDELAHLTEQLSDLLCHYAGGTHYPVVYFIDTDEVSVTFQIDDNVPED